ncbi:DUF1616 domain-containing protein [Chloroflexota bacterium]
MDWIKEIFGFLFPFLESVPFIRATLGFILVFFLPGFAWTFVFFRRIKVLERILLSFAISIAMVTLSLLFANWILKINITGINSVLIIIIVTALPVGIYYLIRFIRRKTGETKEMAESGGKEEEAGIVDKDD